MIGNNHAFTLLYLPNVLRCLFIPTPVWAVGFAHEQPLRDATLTCSASGILKQLEFTTASGI
ncbi:MAG: hypothetical protein LBJ00_13790 [Planctomycetaceae bacterium]|nr:hypothetical protein [Planctomycetaceae bacterium]